MRSSSSCVAGISPRPCKITAVSRSSVGGAPDGIALRLRNRLQTRTMQPRRRRRIVAPRANLPKHLYPARLFRRPLLTTASTAAAACIRQSPAPRPPSRQQPPQSFYASALSNHHIWCATVPSHSSSTALSASSSASIRTISGCPRVSIHTGAVPGDRSLVAGVAETWESERPIPAFVILSPATHDAGESKHLRLLFSRMVLSSSSLIPLMKCHP